MMIRMGALLMLTCCLGLGSPHPVMAKGKTKAAPTKKSPNTPIPKAKWVDLLKKLDSAEAQGNDLKGLMEIVLINKDNKRRFRRALFFQKGRDRRLLQFKYPPNSAGLSVLIRGSVIHLYLPRFKRIQQIAAHVKNQPFMGTDLSFDDLGSLQYAPFYNVKNAYMAGKRTVLVLVPKPGVNKPYKKLHVSVRNKDGLLSRVVFFNKQGKKVKVMRRANFTKIKGYLMPLLVEVHDLVRNHKSQVHMKKVKINTGIRRRFFSKRMLRRTLDL